MNNTQGQDTRFDMERRYCFTEQEFLILAGSLGVRSLYGFKPGDTLKLDEKELYQHLFRMTGKGFLEASEEGYLVMPEIREMFHYLKEARSVITVCAVDNSFPEKCVYPGEKAVLMEPGGLSGKYFKCSYDLPEKIREMLCENELLLSQNVADDMLYDALPIEGGLCEDKELLAFIFGMPKDGGTEKREEMNKCGIRTILEKRDIRHNILEKRIFLTERLVDDIIVVQEEEVKAFHYSRRLFLELLKEWMGD